MRGRRQEEFLTSRDMTDLISKLVDKSVGLRIPLSVHIDLTMRCNEHCVHCYRVIEQRPELTTAELKALLDDVARAGTLYLLFSGGEIFLRRDLFDLLEHARRLHFDIRLKSNAPLVTAKNDGDTSPLALRITRKDLVQVLQDPAMNPDLGKPAPDEIPPGRPDLDEVPCGASHNACYISAYGDVMPCVAMPIACGNVRDEPFEEIWHRSPQMLRVRAIRIRDLHTCASCAASQFCTRCPGQALVETGDLRGPSPASCEHTLARAQAAGSSAVPASMLRPG